MVPCPSCSAVLALAYIRSSQPGSEFLLGGKRGNVKEIRHPGSQFIWVDSFLGEPRKVIPQYFRVSDQRIQPRHEPMPLDQRAKGFHLILQPGERVVQVPNQCIQTGLHELKGIDEPDLFVQGEAGEFLHRLGDHIKVCHGGPLCQSLYDVIAVISSEIMKHHGDQVVFLKRGLNVARRVGHPSSLPGEVIVVPHASLSHLDCGAILCWKEAIAETALLGLPFPCGHDRIVRILQHGNVPA